MNLLQIDTLNAMQNAAAQAVEPEPINLWTMAQYGGVIMIVLAILLAWAIYLFVERLVVLHKAQKEDHSFMDRIKDYIHEGKLDSALNLCKQTNTPSSRMVGYYPYRTPDAGRDGSY